MQEDVFTTRWKQFRNELHYRWKQLDPDDVNQIEGKRINLVFLLESHYGFSRRRAEREVELFVSEFENKLRSAA